MILIGDKEMLTSPFVSLCGADLMLDNSFRLAPLDTSLQEGGKGKRNSGALSGATSSLCSSCRRKRRGEPTSEISGSFPLLYRSDVVLPLKAQPKKKRNAEALSGTTSSQCSSCRLPRGEPTSENNISFSPALSFGCGSSPESATKENEECKSIFFRDYFVASLLVPPQAAGRTDIRD